MVLLLPHDFDDGLVSLQEYLRVQLVPQFVLHIDIHVFAGNQLKLLHAATKLMRSSERTDTTFQGVQKLCFLPRHFVRNKETNRQYTLCSEPRLAHERPLGGACTSRMFSNNYNWIVDARILRRSRHVTSYISVAIANLPCMQPYITEMIQSIVI